MLRFRLGIFVVSDVAKVKSIKVEDFKPIFGHQGASAATRSIENSDPRILAILRKDTNIIFSSISDLWREKKSSMNSFLGGKSAPPLPYSLGLLQSWSCLLCHRYSSLLEVG